MMDARKRIRAIVALDLEADRLDPGHCARVMTELRLELLRLKLWAKRGREVSLIAPGGQVGQ